jgi:KDO2-lipid IV(A) lauroyltransferase
MGISRVALRNLALTFPEKSEEERRAILIGMWDNIGRVAGEYPHLSRLAPRIEIVGVEHLDRTRQNATGAIFFGGHLANWEIGPLAGRMHGLPVSLVYRRPNNPWVDGLLHDARNFGVVRQIAKGTSGGREILSVLKNGGAVGMLMDQKMNEGLAIPFFGRPAMTAPAIAQFALKLDCPLYPLRIERLENARFRVTVFPPLKIEKTNDREADVRGILETINAYLEEWIRAKPEQWLWIHRRWPES